MTLDVLISTIDEGICKVPAVLLPPLEGIGWVVSMQYTDSRFLEIVPDVLKERDDVTLTFLEGRGLSMNRNNAMAHSRADILLMADDDCRYTESALRAVAELYEMNPSYDIVCFSVTDYEGRPLKTYPMKMTMYATAQKGGYYPSSVEMSMRRGVGIRFDKRFGLGAELLCAGEEDVFLKDAVRAGYTVVVCPKQIASTDGNTTGGQFLDSKQLQLTKGAVFRYLYGRGEALWRCLKEACHCWRSYRVNPFPILFNMVRGIWILR